MSWDELEKRRTADIVSRRFGVSAKETVFVRDGYELTRHLLQCARQGRSRAAAIYPADEQETINQVVGDSLNGTRPLLLNQFIRPLRCRYLLQLPGRYGGMVAELEYLSPEPERARRMVAMEAALSRAAADIRGAAGPRAPDWARAYAVVEYAVRHWRYSEDGVWSYTAYGALVDHAAVCMGISLATLLLMERMGVPCRYLHGYRREGNTVGHGWNLIYCGGWFHLDVTDAVTSRDPLRFWGVTTLTDRSLEPGLTLPGPLRCPCPPDFIRQHLRKGTML